MKCLWFSPLLLLAISGVLPAQEPLITPETPVDHGVLHQWLHSGDPRQIAWAADFARKTHDTQIISEMPPLIEHWATERDLGGNSQAMQKLAITAMLDTLIQENAKAQIPLIDGIAEFFPAQAAILTARLPLSESRETLEDWASGANGTWGRRTLARIASMTLAKDPGPSRGFWKGNAFGFVASTVAASEEELQITVSPVNRGHGGGAGALCGDSIGREAPFGWPQVYAYDLVENDPDAHGPVVIELDGDRIVSRRFEENRPWGSCCGVESLDASTRHRLIAHWLGVQEKDMSWQPVEDFTIAWTDKLAYERQLGRIVEAERKKLRATVETLRQRRLLTGAEAATIAPRLIVTVQCELDPCPLN